MTAMVVSGVLRFCQALSGSARFRVWCCPPRSRTWTVMPSLLLIRVTSVMSNRMRRLRSRIGVVGLFGEGGDVGGEGADPFPLRVA
jgi:hypothetical protein